ncbi:hypothetical protein [Chitinophaga caeni]|nr:hypothetical protein [Chitinophaga caeni]
MKRTGLFLLLLAFLFQACASEKAGCPGTQRYSKKDKKRNMKAVKQTRLF